MNLKEAKHDEYFDSIDSSVSKVKEKSLDELLDKFWPDYRLIRIGDIGWVVEWKQLVTPRNGLETEWVPINFREPVLDSDELERCLIFAHSWTEASKIALDRLEDLHKQGVEGIYIKDEE